MTHFFHSFNNSFNFLWQNIHSKKYSFFSGKRYSNSKYHSFKIMLLYSFKNIFIFLKSCVSDRARGGGVVIRFQKNYITIFLFIEALFDREKVPNAQTSMCPQIFAIKFSKYGGAGGGSFFSQKIICFGKPTLP